MKHPVEVMKEARLGMVADEEVEIARMEEVETWELTEQAGPQTH